MTSSPTISVIIPVYNVGPYLEECLQSVAAQTFRDLEAIVVDDGSTDGSGAIADEFAAWDARFRVIRRQNKGVSVARNAGLEQAKGEFVMFVDGDDRCRPVMLETLYRAAMRDDADIAMCDYTRFRNGESADVHVFAPSTPPVVDEFGYWQLDETQLNKVNSVVWNKLYRRRLFDGVRFKEGCLHEDIEIEHRIVSQCSAISVVKQPLYEYRLRDGSITSTKVEVRFLDACEALVERGRYFENRGWWDFYSGNVKHLVSRVARASAGFRQMGASGRKRYRACCRSARRMAVKALRCGKADRELVMRIVPFLIHPRLYLAIVRLKSGECGIRSEQR